MGSIDIFKPLSALLSAARSINPSSIEIFRKNREYRELTLGLLDEKQECYLCAVKPLSLLTLQHLELATIASPYYYKLGKQSYTLETNNQTEVRNGSASLVCCRLVLVPRSPAEYKSALQVGEESGKWFSGNMTSRRIDTKLLPPPSPWNLFCVLLEIFVMKSDLNSTHADHDRCFEGGR